MDNQKAAFISHLIIEEMRKGHDVRAAIDAVLGAGTWQKLADDLWEAFRAKRNLVASN